MADTHSKPKQKSMFKKFWLDVILGTVFIFALLGFFSSFTAFKIFDIFDPIGEAFADMEMTDVVFSQLRDRPVVDDRVVLVNVGNRSRFEIAMMIDSINQFNPLAIGIDIFFSEPHLDDSIGDAFLASALSKVDNLVMPFKAEYNDSTGIFGSTVSWDPFNENAEFAHVNLTTEAATQADLKMNRTIVPQFPIGSGEEQYWIPAFGVKLASYINPEAAENFLERDNIEEVINYRGNIIDYGATKFGSMFFALDHYQILEQYYNSDLDQYERMYVPDFITGSIVIFCFMGDDLADREALEDRYFTPLNSTYVGRAFPDMYGGVIHANVISMVLNEDYIDQLTEWQTWLIAILVCFLNVLAFSWIYKRVPRWYDGITKLIQALEFLGFVFLVIYIMEYYSLKLDLTYTLIVVAVVGDALEVYYGVVKNSMTREGRKELFRVSKI